MSFRSLTSPEGGRQARKVWPWGTRGSKSSEDGDDVRTDPGDKLRSRRGNLALGDENPDRYRNRENDERSDDQRHVATATVQ